MRCKNCGSENNDNLYICQNCGSPLYDEEAPVADDNGSTKMFTPPVAVGAGYDEAQHRPVGVQPPQPEDEDKKDKKQLVIIIVLAVILVAIVGGIIGAVAHNKKENPSTSVSVSDSTLTTETSSTTTEKAEEETTESTTEKETTTTTTTTTQAAKKQYTISVGTNDSGWAEGGGTFKEGDSVTVYCGADDGYAFTGWYKDGKKVSNQEKYTFKANDDVYLEARFEAIETTSASDEGIDEADGGDIG